jgi:hypothetical protein
VKKLSNFFSFRKKPKQEPYQSISKQIDVKLETFNSHLRQIDGEFQVILDLLNEIKENKKK